MIKTLAVSRQLETILNDITRVNRKVEFYNTLFRLNPNDHRLKKLRKEIEREIALIEIHFDTVNAEHLPHYSRKIIKHKTEIDDKAFYLKCFADKSFIKANEEYSV